MKKNPHISIITPNLNNAKYLEETIKSVLNQNFKDFEYIIIDGKSKDRSLKINSNDIEISSANKKVKKYVPLSKRQDKPDSTLWLILLRKLKEE